MVAANLISSLFRRRGPGDAPAAVSERVNRLFPQDEAAPAHDHRLPRVDLAAEPFDPEALNLLPPSEAWSRRILPLRLEKNGRRAVCATTLEHLSDAVNLLHNRGDRAFVFVLTDARQLEAHLLRRYTTHAR